MNILNYELRMTCEACPEQYDVYKGKEQVGYIRLRHGQFRVDYSVCGGKTLLVKHPNSDGVFETDTERKIYLEQAVRAIHAERMKDRQAFKDGKSAQR